MNQSCVNGCCRSKPCLNGGTCEEKCSDVREPYTCTCSKYYKGKRCEQFYPEVKSCQGVKIFRSGSHSGVYELVISEVSEVDKMAVSGIPGREQYQEKIISVFMLLPIQNTGAR